MQHSNSRQKAERSLGNSFTDRSLSSSKVKQNLKSSSREAGVPEADTHIQRKDGDFELEVYQRARCGVLNTR